MGKIKFLGLFQINFHLYFRQISQIFNFINIQKLPLIKAKFLFEFVRIFSSISCFYEIRLMNTGILVHENENGEFLKYS